MDECIILAGDVGGTKANLAFYELKSARLNLLVQKQFPSNEYADLHELIAEFIEETNRRADHVCIAVAGPVVNGTCHATNLPWVIDAAVLAQRLKLNKVELMNDLEANAHGIYELSDEDFVTINQGDKKKHGNVGVISAGTGLGEAGIIWEDRKMRPFASEGGHCDFAPNGQIQFELLQYLHKKFNHVSCERVLSGQGLKNIYDFLRDENKFEEPSWLRESLKTGDAPAIISEHGLKGETPICVEALNIFTDIYGAEAGNLALKLMATGGIFIGGGIAPKMIKKLEEPRFLEAFLEKGRLRSVLETVQIKVIMNDKTALLGAARCALMHAGIFHHVGAL
ncbi:MAG TPA: glucokinase [Drouetiella sp.]|jgi:glucokinase